MQPDVQTESDVEQKLIFPLLTRDRPLGLGIPASNILTKANTAKLRIGKGASEKLYFPDFTVVISSIPMLVIEAKGPGEDLSLAYREARLYAHEINALFPAKFNPVKKVLVANSSELWAGPVDHERPDFQLQWSQMHFAADGAQRLAEFAAFSVLSDELRRVSRARLTANQLYSPKRLIGGESFRSQELPRNSFGETLTLNVHHVFTPENWEDRRRIVRDAYVSSRSRIRYQDPIDRIIRASRPIAQVAAKVIDDSARPVELEAAFKNLRALEAKVVLLVGQVGAGKTTFVDYLQEVHFEGKRSASLVWCRANLNNAPLAREQIYHWVCQQIIESCAASLPEKDLQTLEGLKLVFSVEVRQFERGIGALFEHNSPQYREKLAEELARLVNDPVKSAKAHIRYSCTERQRLLILVLDNCDKRDRDDQLLMFQAAHWAQTELRCLVFLPMREETFENHQKEPPLDTALKDYVFRIEPPLFQQVLIKRVALALKQIAEPGARMLRYDLPNGFHVDYPATEQSYYLTAIVTSVFEHDRFLRRMIAGLAGANVRRALEIFLEFCRSGHIGADEIFKIRQSEGRHALPSFLVARVLLRLNRRFYDSASAYLKNVFSVDPADDIPQYFVRISILRWLEARFRKVGPSGIPGYFPIRELTQSLSTYFDPQVIAREVRSLIEGLTIVTEHLRVSGLDEHDLIRISPAGFVHLDALTNIEYLAAVAEDTWFSDKSVAEHIAGNISDATRQFIVHTTMEHAEILLNFLNQKRSELLACVDSELDRGDIVHLTSLKTAEDALARLKAARSRFIDPWFDAHIRYPENSEHIGRVVNLTFHGVFVELESGLTGLVPARTLQSNYLENRDLLPGEYLTVRVEKVDVAHKKLNFSILSTESAQRFERETM